jgi:hypothetical protein
MEKFEELFHRAAGSCKARLQVLNLFPKYNYQVEPLEKAYEMAGGLDQSGMNYNS